MFNLLTILFLAAESGIISGSVADLVSGAPIEGASVVVVGAVVGVSTGERGGFVLGPVKAGRYKLVASHIAFCPETTEVDVPANGVARVGLRLRLKLIPVPGVTAKSRKRKGEEEMTVREISSEQLERNAGGFVADPVRTLSFLPGVGHSSRGEWSGTYAVRGGEPDESSVYFGNTELLWPYHLLGFSSVINSDIVDQISFYPSVFPVQYGGALSSIAVMKPKRLAHGEGFWAYDPMNMKAAYVGNLGDINFLGSYRRSFYYVLFGPMGAGRYNRPSFSDFTGQAEVPMGGTNRLRLSVVNGSDHIVSDLREVEEEMSEGGSSVSLEFESDMGMAQTNVSVFSNTHDFAMSPAVWWGDAETRQSEYGFKLGLTGTPSRELEFGCGIELVRAGYTGNLLSPEKLERSDNAGAAYLSLGLRPTQRLGLDLGVRYEDVRWALDKVLQPRAVLSLYASDAVVLKAGYRRHVQNSYSFLRNSCASFVFDEQYDDYRLFEQGVLGAKQADHYSLASELRLGPATRLSLEGYVKSYSNLPTWKTDVQGEIYDAANDGSGFARGVELTLEQSRVSGWSGWLTYGLSWCKKQQGTDTMLYWDEYDRRNALNLSIEKAFPGDWTLTTTFHLNTGAPYTPLLYTRSPQGVQGSDLNHGHSVYVIEGEKNSARVPTYHRLDLKFSKELPKLPLHPHLYIEILNVYNRQNAYYLVQFEDRDGRIITGQSTGIPFIPLIGIGGRF